MQGIQGILTAEKEANTIIGRAREDAERIVADAQQAAMTAATEHDAALRKRREDRLQAASARLAEERRTLLAKSEREADALVRAARKRLPAAASLIIGSVRGEE